MFSIYCCITFCNRSMNNRLNLWDSCRGWRWYNWNQNLRFLRCRSGRCLRRPRRPFFIFLLSIFLWKLCLC